MRPEYANDIVYTYYISLDLACVHSNLYTILLREMKAVYNIYLGGEQANKVLRNSYSLAKAHLSLLKIAENTS